MSVNVADARLHAGRMRKSLLAGGRMVAAGLAVLPLEVRARRAVLTELETLDPEVDEHRVTQLVLGSVLSAETFQQALVTVAYWRQVAVPTMAQLIANGGGGAPAATIERLAQIHDTSGESTPDDRRYTVATLCFEPVRVAEILGVRGLTAKEQRALFLFWTGAAESHGIPIPEGQAEFRAWSLDYERRSYRRTTGSVDAASALEQTFLDRCAPGPLRPVGQQVLRAFADATLLDAVGMPPAHPAMKRLTAAAVGAYLRVRRTVPGRPPELLFAPWPQDPYAAVPEVPAVECPVEQADESRPVPSFRPSRRKVGG